MPRPRVPASAYWAALAFAGVVGFSRLCFGVLIPAIRHSLPGSYVTYGWVAGANFDGFLVGIVAIPFALEFRFDRHKLNFVAILLTGLFMIASGFSDNLLQLAIWRFLAGLAASVATILVVSLAVDDAPEAVRGKVSGILFCGAALGMAVCGAIAPAAAPGSPFTWRDAFIAMGVFILAVMVPFARSVANVDPSPEPSSAARGDFLTARFVLTSLMFAFFGAGFIMYSTFIVAFVAQMGIGSAAIGAVWFAMGVAGAIGGIWWGRVYDRAGKGRTIAFAMATAAAGTLIVLAHLHVLTAIGALVVGAASFGIPAMVSAQLRRSSTPSSFASVWAAATAIYGIGQVVGPPLGGAVGDRYGLFTTIVLSGFLWLAGAACALFIDRR
jgi:predicted MFS family arabinose efflux permease